ncbi:alpha/beta hydrolase [Geodermatophilus sp. YIM 151500]|uniref:alpha/beta fold hydrolase n=1 Tax=Geodermatophilus sp. YIM 151500 TaxID=2984531 RepID=UPI0021E4B647|nr:alpha/beta hydrolase [Geodermatophilus sp. YIM 151500]MCV2488331.1 alpha/beta hydrolase [Geodermatophilus sp. YIM 151500]
MSVLARHNVRVAGAPDGRPLVLVHGLGCDQSMWRLVLPDLAADYRVVLLDLAGHGGADRSAYDPDRHGSLAGWAADVVEVCRELDLRDAVLVGHSVSAMIGALAVQEAPELFGALVMVGPSPRYVDEGDYVGGFSRADIADLLAAQAANHVGWAAAMAPVIMANPDRPELAGELAELFCRSDPDVVGHLARVTFLSDNRADLPRVAVPTLVLQCSEDVIAPVPVGRYVHAHVPDSSFVQLRATGHCPQLSAPEETTAAIRAFLGR